MKTRVTVNIKFIDKVLNIKYNIIKLEKMSNI